jgi:proteasome lid subunit RPN8/RPN11
MKKSSSGRNKEKSISETAGNDSRSSGGDVVKLGKLKQHLHTSYRKFPGPPNADVLLRVACQGAAYVDFVAHAKSSLDAEIGGVLVGQINEDDYGPYVHVQAIIQGENMQRGGTHVTFTQDTWAYIHEKLDRHYPKMKIVGWYHSHPGFGVEFSEMDLFIQRNFFSAPTQIALLTDPMSGDIAICVNTTDGIEYLDRFWVGGREVRCHVSSNSRAESQAADPMYHHSGDLHQLEERLNLFMQRVEEQRSWMQSFIMVSVMTVLIAFLTWIGFSIYQKFTKDQINAAVENIHTVPIPVQIDGRTVILTVQIVGIDLSSEINQPDQKEPREVQPAKKSALGGKKP